MRCRPLALLCAEIVAANPACINGHLIPSLPESVLVHLLSSIVLLRSPTPQDILLFSNQPLSIVSLECCSLSDDSIEALFSIPATELNLSNNLDVSDNAFRVITRSARHHRSISNLPLTRTLRSLNLRRTSVSAAAAKGFCSAFSLTHLDLSDNDKITNSIFDEIARCPSLTSLSLQKNEKISTGFAPLTALSALTHLALDGCFKVSDASLEHISLIPSLATLSLRSCIKISSDGLLHLSRLPALTDVDLYGCPRVDDAGVAALAILPLTHVCLADSAVVKSFASLHSRRMSRLHLTRCTRLSPDALLKLSVFSNLKELKVAHSAAVNDQIALSFSALSSLTLLSLSGTQVSGASFAQLSTLKLKTLHVAGCRIYHPDAPLGLELMTDLTSLDLTDTPLTADNFKFLAALTALTALWLVKTSFDDTSVAALSSFASLRALRSLDVADCRALTVLPVRSCALALESLSLKRTAIRAPCDELYALTNLTFLNVCRTGAVDSNNHLNIASLCKLRTLTLAEAVGVDDALMAALPHSLTSLNVAACAGLTAAGMAAVGELKGLRFLCLKGCQIGDEGVMALTGLHRLETLVLETGLLTAKGLEAYHAAGRERR